MAIALITGGGSGIGAAVGALLAQHGDTVILADINTEAADNVAKPFSFAFLTDAHIQPEMRAVEGVKQCFEKANALESKPEFAITGGDLIMDALEMGADRVHQQWQLWDEAMKSLHYPTYHTIGNHDVCG